MYSNVTERANKDIYEKNLWSPWFVQNYFSALRVKTLNNMFVDVPEPDAVSRVLRHMCRNLKEPEFTDGGTRFHGQLAVLLGVLYYITGSCHIIFPLCVPCLY